MLATGAGGAVQLIAFGWLPLTSAPALPPLPLVMMPLSSPTFRTLWLRCVVLSMRLSGSVKT